MRAALLRRDGRSASPPGNERGAQEVGLAGLVGQYEAQEPHPLRRPVPTAETDPGSSEGNSFATAGSPLRGLGLHADALEVELREDEVARVELLRVGEPFPGVDAEQDVHDVVPYG
eukprot:11891700-Heterocapsa_arctica.AAC.1